MSKDLKSGEGWKWYGFAGHLIVSARCQYHLCTNIGDKYLVSTVGCFVPDPQREPHKIDDVGCDRKYETYVFEIDGEGEDGNPKMIEWCEIDGEGYNESLDAERGHYEYCWKYDKELNS